MKDPKLGGKDMRIKVAILEEDQSYLNRIAAVFNSKYADKLEIYSFTNLKVALTEIMNSKINVLISGDSFDVDVSQLPSSCGFAYFSDSASIETIKEHQTIFKFQKAELIYKEILGIYSEASNYISGIKMDDNVSKVITFVSASGGVGSSTLAASCAVYMAKCGKKVLYLNLEQFGNSNLYFNGEGSYDFGDVIYAIKSKKSNMALKLESTVIQDTTGVYFYAPCKIALDLMELTNEDIKSLINDLKIYGGYDDVILDIDFTFSGNSIEILQQSNNIIFVSDGSEISNSKIERAYKALMVLNEQATRPLLNKLSIFYNRFSSKTGKHANIDIHNLGGAPVFAQATNIQVIEQLSNMSFFNELFQ